MSRENKNTYIIDDVVKIRGYDEYIEYYSKNILPRGLMTICVGAQDIRGRTCIKLRSVERGALDATVS